MKTTWKLTRIFALAVPLITGLNACEKQQGVTKSPQTENAEKQKSKVHHPILNDYWYAEVPKDSLNIDDPKLKNLLTDPIGVYLSCENGLLVEYITMKNGFVRQIEYPIDSSNISYNEKNIFYKLIIRI